MEFSTDPDSMQMWAFGKDVALTAHRQHRQTAREPKVAHITTAYLAHIISKQIQALVLQYKKHCYMFWIKVN